MTGLELHNQHIMRRYTHGVMSLLLLQAYQNSCVVIKCGCDVL